MSSRKGTIFRIGLVLGLTLSCWNPCPFAASHAPVRGPRGMVVSSEAKASKVGLEILERGGNAVDAAVAVGFALAVTHPFAGNIGGGGFMLIRLNNGETDFVDYREMAPGKAMPNMYQDSDGNLVKDASIVGYRAVGVPGTVAGLYLALQKYGTLKWSDVIQPSIHLARDGFSVSYPFSQSLRNAAKLLAQFPESKRIFLRDGRFYEEGEIFKQPELADTLERIAAKGPREFYEGETARKMAADMAAHGGLITEKDLKEYSAKLRAPVRGTYRGYEIISAPPPSSGGTALIEILNTLEHFDLKSMGALSAAALHLEAESMRRAFADRAQFMGDADFVKVPVAGLISKEYSDTLAREINPTEATASAAVHNPNPFAYEGTETTHYSIVDQWGNAVANTYTLNAGYGSGVTVKGLGFLLNDEMDDFTSKPGTPNMFGLIQSPSNSIQPRKRPLSAMTPTVVLKDGKLFMVTGSPGGPTIINTVLQTIINVIDFGMNIQEAVDAPRIHHQWMPDELQVEPVGFSADTLTILRTEGYQLKLMVSPLWGNQFLGDAQAILVDPKTGVRMGAADPRRSGKAMGY
ncbi:MAG: gamma-glutamyltransferase [Acidobacteriia bacterium]|nr:gamma-glutamyltransferase [Terriglobia bacterium]